MTLGELAAAVVDHGVVEPGEPERAAVPVRPDDHPGPDLAGPGHHGGHGDRLGGVVIGYGIAV